MRSPFRTTSTSCPGLMCSPLRTSSGMVISYLSDTVRCSAWLCRAVVNHVLQVVSTCQYRTRLTARLYPKSRIQKQIFFGYHTLS